MTIHRVVCMMIWLIQVLYYTTQAWLGWIEEHAFLISEAGKQKHFSQAFYCSTKYGFKRVCKYKHMLIVCYSILCPYIGMGDWTLYLFLMRINLNLGSLGVSRGKNDKWATNFVVRRDLCGVGQKVG